MLAAATKDPTTISLNAFLSLEYASSVHKEIKSLTWEPKMIPMEELLSIISLQMWLKDQMPVTVLSGMRRVNYQPVARNGEDNQEVW